MKERSNDNNFQRNKDASFKKSTTGKQCSFLCKYITSNFLSVISKKEISVFHIGYSQIVENA